MNNRVYTYSNIAELNKASYYKDILPIPQIAMSKEMSTLRFKMPGLGRNIRSFNYFQSQLFPGWNDSAQKFRFVTILNRYLREKIRRAADKHERDWLYGCKKNLFQAISNMIRMEEAKVHPENIPEDDRDLRLFREMWTYLIERETSINDFRDRCRELEQPETFSAAVDEILKLHGRKTVVLNGFQFLTPLQSFVYECFMKSGFSIYALIQDDERYPYACEIWNHLYRKEHGFPDRAEWIRQKDTAKNPLGEIFETGTKVSAPNVRIIKYKNTIEFIEDINRIKEKGYYMYATDDHTVNRILKDYFPERYEVRNLLAYPIGQFIYALHTMWDEELQGIAINQDGLRKCFASGWLSADGKSSANYTEDLERILPFFEGCYRLEQWRDRLGQYYDSCDIALDVFYDGTESRKKERMKDILGNPFHQFGVFSVEEKRVAAVMGVIRELIEMAQSLFDKNEPISIQKHMSKLDALLHMNDGMPQDLFLKERETVKKIFEALESDRVKDFLCYPGDIAAALLAFMGDKLEDDEERRGELRTLVFNIFQVEAAPVSAKGKVHICMADIQKLPGATGRYTWPVDEQLLKGIQQDTQNEYVSIWIDNNKLTTLSNRYYIYAALKNSDVEISWIENQGGKLFAPSPYITLLDKLSDSKITDSGVCSIDLMHVSEIYAHKRLEKEYSITASPEEYSYDSELEYVICPMRFVYGYILGDGPAYRGDYQQNRAIVRLIQILGRLLKGKYSIEQIAGHVFALFPNIRKAEKRQMLDDAKRFPLPDGLEGFTDYGNQSYTDYRLALKIIDNDVYRDAEKKHSTLMSQRGVSGIFFDTKGTDSEKNCELCPHAVYCKKSKFGIDYKEDTK